MTKPRYSENTVLRAPLSLTQPNTLGGTNSHPGRCLFTLSLSSALTLQVMSSSFDLTPHLTEPHADRRCLIESPRGWQEAPGTVTVTTNGEVLDTRQHCPSGASKGRAEAWLHPQHVATTPFPGPGLRKSLPRSHT